MVFCAQDGSAILIYMGSNNRADLTSCTLSGNEAIEVRRHAAQEQFTKHLCMLRLVLLLGCWRMHARGVWDKGDDHAWCFVFRAGAPSQSRTAATARWILDHAR